MKTNVNIDNSINLLCEMQRPGIRIQILEYDELRGSSDLSSAFMLGYMQKANIRLRQVKLTLDGSGAVVERGAISFMRGNLNVTSNAGNPVNLVGRLISSKVTKEEAIRPMITGEGEIMLEPSFGHYMILELEEGEEVIIDDAMFFCAEESVKMRAKMIKSLSGMVLGQETLFQTALTGPGLVVLTIPVPEEEIFKYHLDNDTLKVDGNFAFLRSGNIEFTVEKSTRSLLGSQMAGEGLMQVFRGTGYVYLMQTKSIYEEISQLTNPFAVKDVETTRVEQPVEK